MRTLPLVQTPEGCTLSESGLAAQQERARLLRVSVASAERGPAWLTVSFGTGLDEPLLRRLIAAERECCSFLELDFDPAGRVLRIASDDPRGAGALDAIATFFTDG